MKSIINKVSNYFNEKKKRKASRAATLARAHKNYQALINELRLIQEKKSKLSKREREIVEMQIRYLISKGHITVNK